MAPPQAGNTPSSPAIQITVDATAAEKDADIIKDLKLCLFLLCHLLQVQEVCRHPCLIKGKAYGTVRQLCAAPDHGTLAESLCCLQHASSQQQGDRGGIASTADALDGQWVAAKTHALRRLRTVYHVIVAQHTAFDLPYDVQAAQKVRIRSLWPKRCADWACCFGGLMFRPLTGW